MSQTIFTCQYGSRLFGTNLPDSDEDYRSVVLPSREDILLGRRSKITQVEGRARANVAGDVDKTDLPVQAFLGLLAEGEVTSIETFFAPPIESTPLWERIQGHKEELISSDMSKFIGFAKSQIMRYGAKGEGVAAAREVLDALASLRSTQAVSKDENVLATLRDLSAAHQNVQLEHEVGRPHVPTLILNGKIYQLTQKAQDVRNSLTAFIHQAGERSRKAAERMDKSDLKGLYHAVRIARQGQELLETGEIRFPLSYAPELLRIRAGEVSVDACIARVEEIREHIRSAQEKTTLRPEVSHEFIRDLVLDIHGDVVLNAPENDNDFGSTP